MPQAQNLTLPADCLARAVRHDTAASVLYGLGDEWAVVAYFYGSYHRVRAAILQDPVFDSLINLPKVDPKLNKEHQGTSRHEGRMTSAGRDIGVNDLVRLLYRPIYGHYLVLHDASVQVRYGHGISLQRLQDAHAAWEEISQASSVGALVWSAP